MSDSRKARKYRIRKKMQGTSSIPRLSVFRSNKYIYAQLINDDIKKTITSVSDVKNTKDMAKTKTERAFQTGEKLAQLAQKAKVEKAVFDRSGYKYHGRVKSLAEGARKGGLQF